MNRITYYLGAGASANALPLYSNFQDRLEIFHDFLFHYKNGRGDKSFASKADRYLKSLNLLIKNLDAAQTSTVDALANELYFQNNPHQDLDFHKLKYLISDFFVFEQLQKDFNEYKSRKVDTTSEENYVLFDNSLAKKVNTFVDKRYRSFISPEIEKQTFCFPPEINFISWNYDLQLELAYARLRNSSLLDAQSKLQVFPSPACSNIDTQKSAVIKVNGTAGIYYSDNNRSRIENFIGHTPAFNNSYIDYMVEIFCNNYSRIFGGYPFFTFSFESDPRINTFKNVFINYAKNIISRTDVLIIIGYSFHPLNRSVDKAIFENAENLKKVIIQVPTQDDFNFIHSNFSKVSNAPTEPYLHVNDFLASNNV